MPDPCEWCDVHPCSECVALLEIERAEELAQFWKDEEV